MTELVVELEEDAGSLVLVSTSAVVELAGESVTTVGNQGKDVA